MGQPSQGVALLAPPYERLDEHPTSFPPGAVLVCAAAGGLISLASMLYWHHSAPWCPVCIVTPRQMLSAAKAALPPVVLQPVIMDIRSEDDEWPSAREVLDCVLLRPPPPASAIAAYIAARTGKRKLGEALRACLLLTKSGSNEGFSRASLSRKLRAFGPLTARDWRSIAYMIRIVIHAQKDLGTTASLERAALRQSIDPRTLRAWLQKYVGVRFPEATKLAGWEWMLETVLRTYIEPKDSGIAQEAWRAG